MGGRYLTWDLSISRVDNNIDVWIYYAFHGFLKAKSFSIAYKLWKIYILQTRAAFLTIFLVAVRVCMLPTPILSTVIDCQNCQLSKLSIVKIVDCQNMDGPSYMLTLKTAVLTTK